MSGRLKRLLAKFDKAGIDSLFVSSEPNVSYITGFGGIVYLVRHEYHFGWKEFSAAEPPQILKEKT